MFKRHAIYVAIGVATRGVIWQTSGMTTRPFRRRRLGRELAAYRNAKGLTGEQAAKLAMIAASSITRIEGGKFAAKVSTVKNLLDVYEVTGPKKDALIALARGAGEEIFWQSYTDVLADWFELYIDLEAEAADIAVYDAQFINGLAQTEDYARAMFETWRPDEDPESLQRRVKVRMERQARVRDGKTRLRLILAESALRRRFGGRKVMAEQYRQLATLAQHRNVSVQILPDSAPVGVLGSFTILDFTEADLDPSVVYLEHETGALYVEKADEIRQYARVYDGLRAAARDPETTVEQLTQLAEDESNASRPPS